MNIYAESLGGRKCFGMEVICRDHNNAPVPKNTVQGRFFFHLFLKNSITLNLYILHLLPILKPSISPVLR